MHGFAEKDVAPFTVASFAQTMLVNTIQLYSSLILNHPRIQQDMYQHLAFLCP